MSKPVNVYSGAERPPLPPRKKLKAFSQTDSLACLWLIGYAVRGHVNYTPTRRFSLRTREMSETGPAASYMKLALHQVWDVRIVFLFLIMIMIQAKDARLNQVRPHNF